MVPSDSVVLAHKQFHWLKSNNCQGYTSNICWLTITWTWKVAAQSKLFGIQSPGYQQATTSCITNESIICGLNNFWIGDFKSLGSDNSPRREFLGYIDRMLCHQLGSRLNPHHCIGLLLVISMFGSQHKITVSVAQTTIATAWKVLSGICWISWKTKPCVHGQPESHGQSQYLPASFQYKMSLQVILVLAPRARTSIIRDASCWVCKNTRIRTIEGIQESSENSKQNNLSFENDFFIESFHAHSLFEVRRHLITLKNFLCIKLFSIKQNNFSFENDFLLNHSNF